MSRILLLITLLNNPRQQYNAERELIELAPHCIPYLWEDYHRYGVRCDRVMVKLQRTYPEYFTPLIQEKLDWPYYPWIDQLSKDFKGRNSIIDRYLNRAQHFPCEGPTWIKYRAATEIYIQDLLKKGKSRDYIYSLLNVMIRNEIDYIIERGHGFNNPPLLPLRLSPGKYITGP